MLTFRWMCRGGKGWRELWVVEGGVEVVVVVVR